MFERLSAEPIYNTRAVVRRTGVPADTFRAWERRYGVPSPLRTEGNQRLYSERDIRIISWLREQTAAGLTISQAILLMRSNRPLGSTVIVPGHATGSGDRQIEEALSGKLLDNAEPLSSARTRMIEAFSRLDGQLADHILQETYAWADLEAVLVELLHGSVVEILHRPDLMPPNSPAFFFANSFVHRKFSSLLNLSNPNDGRGPILACAVEDEPRTITLHLAMVFLSRAGYRVCFMNQGVPWNAFQQAVAIARPAAVFLAANSEASYSVLLEWQDRLAALPAEAGFDFASMPICYNGQVFLDHPELRETIRGYFIGSAAMDAVAVIDEVTNTRSI
ncbi:MAG TPA: MerR family transcriptional regulator [Thermomicrobiales bacterium]|nr:MerR family transcriptional regulator [Thermomicrobiales bacterium]